MPFIRTINPIFLIMMVSTLAACGGSSGTGGPAAAPPAPVETATAITAANAENIAVAVANAVFTIDQPAALAIALVDGGLPTANAKTQSSVMAVETIPADCDLSGTVALTVTSDDFPRIASGVLAPGDELSLDFTNCEDLDGVVTDGKYGIAIKDFNATGNTLTGLYRVEADLNIVDFAVTINQETVTLNTTDVVIVLDLTDPSIVSIAISGGVGSSVDERSTSGSVISLTEFAFNTSALLGEDITFTTDGHGKLMSSDFDREVSFDIDPAFQSSSAGNPTIGKLVITGATNGRIELTNFNDIQAKLDIVPSDGGTETTDFINWDQLLP